MDALHSCRGAVTPRGDRACPGHTEGACTADAIAIALQHPFLDGNKRTAYVAMETVLRLNGMRSVASDAEAVVAMVDMAAGEFTDAEFTLWMREHAQPA